MNQEQMNGLPTVDDSIGMAEIQKGLDKLEKMSREEIATPSQPEEEEDPEPQEVIQEEEETPLEEHGEDDMPTDSPDAVAPEDDIFEDEKSKPKIEKAWKLKKAIHRERSEKFALRAEVEALKKQLSDSLDMGAQFYQQGTLGELERAKELKKEAFKTGDIDAVIEADLAINRATLSLHELNTLNAQKLNTINAQTTSKPQDGHEQFDAADNDELQEIYSNIAEEWVEKHAYLQPTSKNYDRKLTEKVVEYAKNLDVKFQNNNQDHLIYSEKYFDKLDSYIEGIHAKNAERALNLAAANHIGAVRGATPAVRRASPRALPALNDTEKGMCRNMGISPDVWKKYKEELNKQPTRR